jgi:molybdopterin-containing oxidoreductase family membrane subunit
MGDVVMQSPEAAAERIKRAPLVTGNRSMSWITDHVASVTEKGAPKWWWIAFTVSASLAMVSVFCIGYLISTGVGVWGLNHPVGWAWDITNFVFWIGIGHAGTLISAILFLTRQKWRTSINRAAEAMTLFAVVCAGIFPAVHVGRIWMVWFLAPVPNSNAIWQNFRSPLLWDVFAVSTYFTVSVLFWYTGLVPDLATLRDRATNKFRKFFYGIAALGWRGGNRQWKHYEMAYLILAGLSTPLVLSVHSVVSFDFATSVIPGWHTTIFPPYFVAGAIFGGFAMVLTIMLPARAIFGLHDLITDDHVDKMCKIILLTGSIVGYAYAMEFFIAWYGGNLYEQYAFINRATGPYWWAYWSMIFCNVVAPQLFWFRFFRRHVLWVFVVCMFVNAGMWFERFVIIVTSLHRDFLPSSWNMFYPTWVDIWTFVGTFGIFLSLFLLFIRWLPMICIFEVKAVLPEADPHHGHDDHHAPAAALKGAAH